MAHSKPKPAIKPVAPAAVPKSAAAKKPRGGAKREVVIALLRREQGATMAELMVATGWQPHSTRAVITGLRKDGHDIACVKRSGPSYYKIEQAA